MGRVHLLTAPVSSSVRSYNQAAAYHQQSFATLQCFGLKTAVLKEVSNRHIQQWQILLKMCTCGVQNKNKTFPNKTDKILKIFVVCDIPRSLP
jgi:protein-tyrosine-phosphatase